MLCEVCKGGFKESGLVVCAVPMAPYFARVCHDCLNPTADPRPIDFTADKTLFRCTDGYREIKEMSKPHNPETVYGLSICEDCDKSTDVVYKCYVDNSLWPPWEACGLIENVVYRCYECAFGGDDNRR